MGDKLQPRFYGPFIVAEVLGRGVYRLTKENGEDIKQSVNATNLKPWVEQVSPSSTPQKQRTPSKQTPPTSPSTPQKKRVRRMPSLSPQRAMPVKQPTSPGSLTTPVTVKSGDDSTPTPPAWWVRDLHLTAEERDIIERGDWLNDKVVDAVNNLVAKHLQIPDCQSSVMAQSEFCPVGQAVQILYDRSHWVAVASDDQDVLVANSAGDTVSTGVIKQLKELFHGRVEANGQLRVGLVRCMQQPNSSDCGVFAAAFVFEWAVNSLQANLDTRFDVAGMRHHLIQCLQRQEVAPFPKTRPQRKQKQRAALAARPASAARLTRYIMV